MTRTIVATLAVGLMLGAAVGSPGTELEFAL